MFLLERGDGESEWVELERGKRDIERGREKGDDKKIEKEERERGVGQIGKGIYYDD